MGIHQVLHQHIDSDGAIYSVVGTQYECTSRWCKAAVKRGDRLQVPAERDTSWPPASWEGRAPNGARQTAERPGRFHPADRDAPICPACVSALAPGESYVVANINAPFAPCAKHARQWEDELVGDLIEGSRRSAAAIRQRAADEATVRQAIARDSRRQAAEAAVAAVDRAAALGGDLCAACR